MATSTKQGTADPYALNNFDTIPTSVVDALLERNKSGELVSQINVGAQGVFVHAHEDGTTQTIEIGVGSFTMFTYKYTPSNGAVSFTVGYGGKTTVFGLNSLAGTLDNYFSDLSSLYYASTSSSLNQHQWDAVSRLTNQLLKECVNG